MFTLKTTEGKEIKLNKAYIEVSRNPEGGFWTDFKLVGCLPRCKKSVALTYSLFHVGCTSLHPLFGYNKYHDVSKSDFQKLIDVVEVRNRGLWKEDFVELTPEVVEKAKKIVSFFYANGEAI